MSNAPLISLPSSPARLEDVLPWTKRLLTYLRANALLDSPDIMANSRTIGTTLKLANLTASATVAAAAITPWQPYASAWQGDGTDPHSDDRKMRFRLTPGEITGGAGVAYISNLTDEFVAFGDVDDDEIEQVDAVWTQIYAKVAIEQTDAKTLQLDDGQILLAETTGPQFEEDALPEPIPDFDADGNFPPYLVMPLRKIAYWGGQIHLDAADPTIGSGVSANLNVNLVVTDAGCETQSKAVQWTRT